MNYRHAFHAGNFADLVKHGVLTALMSALTREGAPLTVVDTHSGAGAYDLTGEMSRRSGEAAAGIFRLMAAADSPPAFQPLKDAVAAMNRGGEVVLYPGSPLLVSQALRKADRYFACELREDDWATLRDTLKPFPNAEALNTDGYAAAVERIPAKGRAFVLIDPPFERGDDYAQIARAAGAVRRKNPEASLAVWVPLKDLETLDRFLREMEDAADASLLVAESRLRPLNNPMKMNGCAMVMLGAPEAVVEPATSICHWVAERLGDAGGEARIWRT
ncbi:23S rRNA (adenine(2030)-N(6))-methyltransferase RlmJ [Caulobacter segnis]|uniref:23S rRNA (adenine(2030)-N(6))-methyltransferase RlmJ n=1 Tax=Caulobacter segnis TaxID=88688 RepID=UPI00240FC3F6|nr:23S rRNA (adenine(2030)-N(6))-methyltransferase RlmJ [Caulobacter segnis]MDG2522976.1 23S rRNA (adenine(2030)-N(6))-methyltransferase RlmJ [Caulobacter segnis]